MSSTYERGRVALWDRRGRLDREIGRGAGDGPGEFSIPQDIESTSDGRVLIAHGNRLLEYDEAGDFIGQRTFDRSVGEVEEVAPGRLALLISGTGVVLTEGENDTPVPDAAPLDPTTQLGAALATGDGFFAVSRVVTYEIRSFSSESGDPVGRVSSAPEWFQESSTEELRYGRWRSSISRFTIDENGYFWVVVRAPDSAEALDRFRNDADAVANPMASVPEVWDTWIEVLSPEGRVIASARFDDSADAPTLSRSDAWTITDEFGELVAVELELVGRVDR